MKTNKLIEKTKGYFIKSFTLIELIVVIVVIGILAAIVVPNISSFKDEAKTTAMVSNWKNLQTGVDMYQLDNHGDFPTIKGEGESTNPTLGNPQSIDFDVLHPDYIRDLPQINGMHYWIDYQGQVYQSMVDNPDDFEQSDAGLTWTADPNASDYTVYEVESSNAGSSKKHILKTVGKPGAKASSYTPEEYSKEKVYLINVTDVYGNQAAPVKKTYSGIAPFEHEASNDPLTPAQEVLVREPTNLMVSAGSKHTLVVKENGELWGFGYNPYGQLGTGSNSPTRTGTPIKIMENVKIGYAGTDYSLVVSDNGDLWSFGRNREYTLGYENNNGTNNPNPVPQKIMTNVKSVSGGFAHVLVVTTTGELWSFGKNLYGELGHSNGILVPLPQKVLEGVKTASAGREHSLVLTSNNELLTFGKNNFGQLGHSVNIGSNKSNPVPTKVLDNIKTIVAGHYHSMVIKDSGELWTFGYNSYGQLGYSTINSQNPTPKKVASLVKSVSSAGHSVLMLKENGQLYSFGSNDSGQLGHTTNSGNWNANSTPQLVMSNVAIASMSYGHSLVVKDNNEIWGFGNNGDGQLGRTPYSQINSTPQIIIISE